jgi:hypothetical protein
VHVRRLVEFVDFFVLGDFAAALAKFIERYLVFRVEFVLFRKIVVRFADGALECEYDSLSLFSHRVLL